jgi:hypothetical protein
MGAAVTAKGSQHGGGSGDDGVLMEAAMAGSRQWQRALQLLTWQSSGGNVHGKQIFEK